MGIQRPHVRRSTDAGRIEPASLKLEPRLAPYRYHTCQGYPSGIAAAPTCQPWQLPHSFQLAIVA